MDTGIDRMKVLANEIVGFVIGPAQRMEIGEVERGLMKRGMMPGSISHDPDSRSFLEAPGA